MTSKLDSEADFVEPDAAVSGVVVLDPADLGPEILAAHALALSALAEVTSLSSVGEFVDYVRAGDDAISLRFANTLPGYPAWFWNVTISHLFAEDGSALTPTVLELELLPDAGALLAPDWVPWAQRLADYQEAQQRLAAEQAAAEAETTEEDDFDEDDLDSDGLDLDLDDADLLAAAEGLDVVENDDDADGLIDLDAADFDTDGSPLLHSGDLDGVDIDED